MSVKSYIVNPWRIERTAKSLGNHDEETVHNYIRRGEFQIRTYRCGAMTLSTPSSRRKIVEAQEISYPDIAFISCSTSTLYRS